jgi:hypothetical protein
VDPAFADKLMALLTERTIPAPELEKLDALVQGVFQQMFAGAEPRARISTDAAPEEEAELERRIDEALRSEKE